MKNENIIKKDHLIFMTLVLVTVGFVGTAFAKGGS